MPRGLDLPDRAMALRPTAMILHRVTWSALYFNVPRYPRDAPVPMFHYVGQEVELRIPFDALLLEASMGGRYHEIVGQYAFDNPELGAMFRDAPAPGFRYELGSAMTVPIADTVVVEREEPPPRGGVSDLYPRLPIRNVTVVNQGAQWNVHRALLSTIAIIPRMRFELDPLSFLALGLEVDIPIVMDIDRAQVEVYPQIAIEIAGRFEEASFIGTRVELTSYRAYNFLLEPFVRLAFDGGPLWGFVRVAARFSVASIPGLGFFPIEDYSTSAELGALF
jgi:hypothetical protein